MTSHAQDAPRGLSQYKSADMSSTREITTIEGNEAAAYVAYKTSEVIAIYPITPSSLMSEFCDQWSASHMPNLWGTVPLVQEMQSEGGAAGAIHGALQSGSLATTFTAVAGLAADDPEHVQDRRRADEHGVPHRRPLHCGARPHASSATTAM